MKYFLYFMLLTVTISTTVVKKKVLKIGDMLPDFTLIDEQGNEFTSSNYFNKQPLVIFFYPKDGSPICTTEVCSIRDSYTYFKKFDAKVVGISSDNIISHRKFKKEHLLPFILLSDHSRRIQKLFGIARSASKTPQRVTFITNKKGRIKKILHNDDNAEIHVIESIKTLKQLNK